ncbi:MAG TPA: hypothetical protein VFZ59_13260 [Verrucomicrobiae bacterium]|nr:hypothetical protein [Verrucomicrobiae bacterium]
MKTKCPHCREKLGNFVYATECPFCHKELEHNRRPTELSSSRSSHAAAMLVSAGIGMSYVLMKAAGVPLPGLGDAPGLGSLAFGLLVAGVLGALVGRIIGVALTRHAKGKQARHVAFLASFVTTERTIQGTL